MSKKTFAIAYIATLALFVGSFYAVAALTSLIIH